MSKQFFLPTNQEPWYKVRMIPVGVANCFPPLPAAKLAFVVNTGRVFYCLCKFHALSTSKWLDTLLASLIPRFLCGGREKRAWYTLLAHVPSSLH